MGWFNHCMVYFLSSLPLLLLILLVGIGLILRFQQFVDYLKINTAATMSIFFIKLRLSTASALFRIVSAVPGAPLTLYSALCFYPGAALVSGKQPGVLPPKEAAEHKAVTSICFHCVKKNVKL